MPLFDSVDVTPDELDDSRFTFEELGHPGFLLAPNTRYWAVLTASPLVEGMEPIVNLAAVSRIWRGYVRIDVPTAELDPGSEPGWSLDVPTLASLTNLTAPEWEEHAHELELDGISVLRMSIVTHPVVEVAFEEPSYTIAESDDAGTPDAEENRVTVTMSLSEDPKRSVTIPIVKTNQGGATSADYSEVPSSVTFAAGETKRTFTFTAVEDSVDDDDESVLLELGTLPVGVNAGTTGETTVTITDDDDPQVKVNFEQAAYRRGRGERPSRSR